MEENFDIKALEITRRFYLNPAHQDSPELKPGAFIRMKHKNVGLIQGIFTGFEAVNPQGDFCFTMNLADGKPFKAYMNFNGYYSIGGGDDRLGLLLLSTATEREEIDFSTVRKQNHFPEQDTFCLFHLTLFDFMDLLVDQEKLEFAWVIDREVVKSLFQLHDLVIFRFKEAYPETGNFKARAWCPGYQLELNYNHSQNSLEIEKRVGKDQLYWLNV